jgi:hypothetical protein
VVIPGTTRVIPGTARVISRTARVVSRTTWSSRSDRLVRRIVVLVARSGWAWNIERWRTAGTRSVVAAANRREQKLVRRVLIGRAVVQFVSSGSEITEERASTDHRTKGLRPDLLFP